MIEQITRQERTRTLLHALGFPIQQGGYRRLCVALPRFAQNPEQSLGKELYPYVAEVLGCTDDVESSIRRSIHTAWKHGNRAVWEQYFPGLTRQPSNRVFIATLAEYLQMEP